jgi:hypothetical protein
LKIRTGIEVEVEGVFGVGVEIGIIGAIVGVGVGVEIGTIIEGISGVRVEVGTIGNIVVVEVIVNKMIFKAENINCSRSWSESDKGNKYRSWIANVSVSCSKGRYRSWSQDCRWRRNWSVNRSISRSRIK